MTQKTNLTFSDSKPHYNLLDGLRGVAALMVVWYHIFEGYASSPFDQKFNHGYLAVDFFFILSGFVVAYAYDDRWNKGMKLSDFFKRRLIRLQPMVILGAVLGAITFYIQGCEKWDGTSVSVFMVFIAMIMSMFMIPAIPGSSPEIRGNGEMFPINGPSWSLFFEYIGNILYALFIRRLSNTALAILISVAAVGLSGFAIFISEYGNLGAGWTMAGYSFWGGFLRLLFSFSIGLFISRIFKPIKIKGAFWICSIIIIILLSVPYVGGENKVWMNGIYDSVCTILIFPFLVYLGASGRTEGKTSEKICNFLGKLSYPLYMIHYPFMYLFYSWLWKNNYTFGETWYVTLIMFFGNILIAYLCLKIYDEPIRKWLTNI